MCEYRLFLEEIGDLEEGWYCGHNQRVNGQFHRTENKEDADVFDDYNAVLICGDFNRLGYPCKIYPKIDYKRMLEIIGVKYVSQMA